MKRRRPKRNKYNARKVCVDGYKFDSMREANRYLCLKNMLSVGIIRDLELQPEYVLQEGFLYKGKKYREIKYRADFRYLDIDDIEWVEDVKGKKTKEYGIKKKLLLKKYPGINFREV